MKKKKCEKRNLKQKNTHQLDNSSLDKVSGGTVEFHVFEDGSAGWVASAYPGDIYKSSKDARAVDKASGGSGISASKEESASQNIVWHDLVGLKDEWNNPLSRY